VPLSSIQCRCENSRLSTSMWSITAVSEVTSTLPGMRPIVLTVDALWTNPLYHAPSWDLAFITDDDTNM